MIVYRIGKAKYAFNLSGEGARLNGGRWNHKMVSCLYTSASRALAILEYTVNINIDEIPRALTITEIEIPGNSILNVEVAALPGDWQKFPAPTSTKNFGSKHLQEARYAAIRIPSAIIPFEYNYLLNPIHHLGSTFKVLSVEDFIYDLRIKK